MEYGQKLPNTVCENCPLKEKLKTDQPFDTWRPPHDDTSSQTRIDVSQEFSKHLGAISVCEGPIESFRKKCPALPRAQGVHPLNYSTLRPVELLLYKHLEIIDPESAKNFLDKRNSWAYAMSPFNQLIETGYRPFEKICFMKLSKATKINGIKLKTDIVALDRFELPEDLGWPLIVPDELEFLKTESDTSPRPQAAFRVRLMRNRLQLTFFPKIYQAGVGHNHDPEDLTREGLELLLSKSENHASMSDALNQLACQIERVDGRNYVRLTEMSRLIWG